MKEQTQYDTYLMYKVTVLSTGKIALFEGKADAEKYAAMMEEKGYKATLNKWTWETKVEVPQ